MSLGRDGGRRIRCSCCAFQTYSYSPTRVSLDLLSTYIEKKGFSLTWFFCRNDKDRTVRGGTIFLQKMKPRPSLQRNRRFALVIALSVFWYNLPHIGTAFIPKSNRTFYPTATAALKYQQMCWHRMRRLQRKKLFSDRKNYRNMLEAVKRGGFLEWERVPGYFGGAFTSIA